MNQWLTKLPYEEFPRRFTFGQEMVADEEVILRTVTCVNLATGEDTKADIIYDEETDGTVIIIKIRRGVLGETHKITVKIQTSLDNVLEQELFLEIIRPDNDIFPKQPSEEFSIANNFVDDLEEGDHIVSNVVAAIKLLDASDATDVVIKGSGLDVEKHETHLHLGVMSGVDGEVYDLSSRVVTFLGYKYEKIITMILEDK